ncbi:GNAT family N-acetyltransferase [Planotetraspora phitsanulokensis]|uniref:GNAT family N-acetyltransferase n=1 Tax=Planotetraspora phitsanulokensis TaxID=575192 RepID=A0A8J3XF51_9ACTN|nr:GNAT family N-acetyltransferase [Planotetraspora phitsanulokensis]GII38765.1 GNAT family N-acetyltransferase [Planotetraspora phitsanulokensis]
MQIERVDFSVPGDRMSGLYAADRADPGPGPRMSFRHFQVVIEHGWSDERSEAWVARRSGEIVGGYALIYPQSDNTHLAMIRLLTVHPDHRRGGVGGSLLRHAVDRARAEGRRVILAEAAVDRPGAQFAEAFGFSPAATEARRVLDLRTADWSGLELMRGDAVRHARDYSLERWAGPVSEEQLGDMPELMSGMNDEPLGDLDIEDQHWDPARIRAHDRMMAAAGLRAYTMVARHTSTGQPAGFTRIAVDAHEPDGWARQHDTAVLRPHRGRRLGLILKLANLAWFHACEPSVERVVTWNSTSNSHMLGINEKMGFQVLDLWNEWQLRI